MSKSAFRQEQSNGFLTAWWTPVAPLAFVVMHRFGLMGHAPLWYIVVSTWPLWMMPFVRLHPGIRAATDGPLTPTQLRVFTPVVVVMMLFVEYGIGWGPILTPTMLFAPATVISIGDGRLWRRAAAWTVAGIVAAQVTVQLGWTYSYLDVPEAHAVAAIGALFVVFMSHALGTSALRGRRAEHQLDALIQNSSDMTTVVNRDGQIIYQSASVRAVLGREPGAMVDTMLIDLAHPDDVDRTLAEFKQSDRVEVRLAHADGSWRWCEARLARLFDDELIGGAVLNIRDVSDRKALEEQLRFQAFHDQLTGLANRARFGDRLEQALVDLARRPANLALLLIDLDDFKQINDSLGHIAGDDLLVVVGTRLRACTREGDTVARLGGDEFAILLEHWENETDLERTSARILAAFAEGIQVGDNVLPLTASVGVAVAAPWNSAEELVRNADVAMYAAKSQGKGCAVRFEPDMQLEVQQRLARRMDLRTALETGEQLRLHYRSVVDLATGVTVGVEALVRWNHPEHGLIAPIDFLPVAEETGLIIPLGRWVLAEACRQAAEWNRASERPIALSVNISARQLEHPSLVADVAAALDASGLDPRLLVLEIDERVLMSNQEITCVLLAQLKALGLRVAIDDFGTSYSSLGHLRALPVDILKVDRCLADGVTAGGDGAALAEAVVTIGRSLRLETVAEGAETLPGWLGQPMPDQTIDISVKVPALPI